MDNNSDKIDDIKKENIIKNPWLDWESNDIQKITTKSGVCLNYLKSTDDDYITKKEDLKLLEVYHYLVENFDISETFGFEMIAKWHHMIFDTIYPFAGELRTVNMSKGNNDEAWEWRLDF